MPDLAARARSLLDLHRAPDILVLANVWDVVSATVVAGTDGVQALATASHSVAATFGYEDGENIPLDLHLDMVGRIVEAVLAAGRDAGIDFVLNARTDAFVRAARDVDRGRLVEEAIRRGRAFLDAGAPVVFVPGVIARAEISALVDAFGPQRLGVISVPEHLLPVRELQDLGVARVSTGPFTQRVALTALQDATAALGAGGTLPEGTHSLN